MVNPNIKTNVNAGWGDKEYVFLEMAPGETATVQDLFDILKLEIEAGRGNVPVKYDTEARIPQCHLVSIHHAGFQGELPYDPNRSDGLSDTFVLFPAWNSGEFG